MNDTVKTVLGLIGVAGSAATGAAAGGWKSALLAGGSALFGALVMLYRQAPGGGPKVPPAALVLLCAIGLSACGEAPEPLETRQGAVTIVNDTARAIVGKGAAWAGGPGINEADSFALIPTVYPGPGQTVLFSTYVFGQPSPTTPTVYARAGVKAYKLAGGGATFYTSFYQVSGQPMVTSPLAVAPGHWVRTRIFLLTAWGGTDISVRFVLDNYSTGGTATAEVLPLPAWPLATFKGTAAGLAVDRPPGSSVPAFEPYFGDVSFMERFSIGWVRTDPSWAPQWQTQLTNASGLPLVTATPYGAPGSGTIFTWHTGS